MSSTFALPSILRYKRQDLRHDALAALVLTAITIPQSLAFAVVVGLPPVTGLYTALLAPIIFALFASTRRLVIGADSATAALLASSATLIAQAGTAGYANAIAILGILTAIILVLIAVLRLGFLSDLVSRPVLIGFLAGVGLQLIITSLPVMMGVQAKSGGVWDSLVSLVQSPIINWMTVTVTILVVGVLLLVRGSKLPGELIAITFAILFAAVFHVEKFDVTLVGDLPSHLPQMALPVFSLTTIWVLLPAAMTVAMIILAQSSAVVRGVAEERGEKIRINQDLFALGLANAAAAITQGFAVNGSPPRTMAVDKIGGRTQLTGILSSVLVGIVLVFGVGALAYLPQAALASVVCLLGVYLIRLKELQYLWDVHRTEFVVAVVALLGTAFIGVLQGVLIAVIVSLSERVIRQYHPNDAILLRDGELSDWARERLSDRVQHSHQIDGVLVYSFDGSLFFENINYFVARLKRAIKGAKAPVRVVVIDAGSIESIDYTAVEAIKRSYRKLNEDHISLRFAHVSPNLHKQFVEFGVVELLGHKHIFSTLTEAITGKTPSHSEESKEGVVAKDH